MNRNRLNEAESIFHDVVGLDSDARHRALERCCGDDHELQRIVIQLLGYDDSGMAGFLAMPAFLPSDELAVVAPLSNPKSIGGYEIVRRIGEGGMGVVYEARQTNPRRTVALKVLRSTLPSPSMLARFQHEAHILAQLQHPGIAHIYEAAVAQVPLAGDVTTAQPFFAMELVEGRPLRAYADDRQLNIQARLELMILVCNAVQHAHEKGVIHRDLKPDNVLVDGFGLPRVLDFGVARLIGEEREAESFHTRAGEIIGTLAYMSPEQVDGDATQVDTRSDIYSLGVIPYDLLTGQLPHNVSRLSLTEATRRIRDDEPPLPSRHNPRLRGDLDWIVMKCLDKNREGRYASAGALADDIRRHLNHEPVTACRQTRLYRARKFARRNRTLVASMGAILLALLLGVVGTSWQAFRASKERDRASDQAARASQTADLLTRVLQMATPEISRGENPTVREMLDIASTELERDKTVTPLVAADAHRTFAEAYYSLGHFDRALRHAQIAAELQTSLLGPDHPDTLANMATLAETLSSLDRDEEALQVARNALDTARAVHGADDPVSVQLSVIYSCVFSNAPGSDRAEVLRLSREAYEQSVAVFGRENLQALGAGSNYGVDLMNSGLFEDAEQLFHVVLDARRSVLGADHPDVFAALKNLMAVLDRRLDRAGAREIGVELVEMANRVLGEEHPRTRQYALDLNSLNFRLGRFAEAEAGARRQLESAALQRAPYDSFAMKFRGQLVSVLIKLNRLDEAQSLATKQYEHCRAEYGARHEDTLTAVTLMFDVVQAQGHLADMHKWGRELKGTRWEEAVLEEIRSAESTAAQRAPSRQSGDTGASENSP